jgi:Zn-dependent protease
MPRPSGSVRLFQFAGVNVYLHWTWAIVAWLMLRQRMDSYAMPAWALLEYLALFGIVLMHEYGHALACRQVGGRAETILLWPLGGVAFVQAPPRPGAQLWSIVAGPLVNVMLLAPTAFLAWWTYTPAPRGDLAQFCLVLAVINAGLLVFNLLPVYPLDGGQILRALLWFVVGPAQSLMAATVIGLVASAGALLICLRLGDVWLTVIAAFAAWQSWMGLQQARRWMALHRLPRHLHAQCPHCRAHPPAVPGWRCQTCGSGFDILAARGQCPTCGATGQPMICPECGNAAPVASWVVVPQATMTAWADPR